MSHIFDAKKFEKLDHPERKKSLPIEIILPLLQLSDQMILADVGCGTGYFSFPMSRVVKRVHAVDISEIMITELNQRISNEPIETLLGDFNKLLSDNSLDRFFTSTVIHELPDLNTFTEQALSKLKIGGQIAYLDFEKNASKMGPPNEKRIASETVKALFKSFNLKGIKSHSINDHFYLVTGEK